MLFHETARECNHDRAPFFRPVILPMAKTTLENARANLEALAGFGITAEILNAFETRIESANVLPTEEVNRLKWLNRNIFFKKYID